MYFRISNVFCDLTLDISKTLTDSLRLFLSETFRDFFLQIEAYFLRLCEFSRAERELFLEILLLQNILRRITMSKNRFEIDVLTFL